LTKPANRGESVTKRGDIKRPRRGCSLSPHDPAAICGRGLMGIEAFGRESPAAERAFSAEQKPSEPNRDGVSFYGVGAGDGDWMLSAWGIAPHADAVFAPGKSRATAY
jgi:hypothetical protein